MNHPPSACRLNPPSPVTRRRHGLSLIELLCSVAAVMVLVGGVLPMLKDLRWSQALQSAAALLETDLQYARVLAVSSGRPVRLSIQAAATGDTCYVVHTGAAHACRCDGQGQAQCDAGAELLRLESQAGATGLRLAPVARSILFDGGKGTVTPTATLQLTDRDGRGVHVVVNIMGRVRSCVPTGRLGGLRPCQ
jgi:type IV fimbrial biogenesis protein FimT